MFYIIYMISWYNFYKQLLLRNFAKESYDHYLTQSKIKNFYPAKICVSRKFDTFVLFAF